MAGGITRAAAFEFKGGHGVVESSIEFSEKVFLVVPLHPYKRY